MVFLSMTAMCTILGAGLPKVHAAGEELLVQDHLGHLQGVFHLPEGGMVQPMAAHK
jgi:hypothetical protein